MILVIDPNAGKKDHDENRYNNSGKKSINIPH